MKYNYQRLGFVSDYDMIDQLRREWLPYQVNGNRPQQNVNGLGTLYVNGMIQQPTSPFSVSIDDFLYSCISKGTLVSKIINLLSIDYLKYLDLNNLADLNNLPKPLIVDIVNDSFDKKNSLLFIEENIMTEKFISLGFVSDTFNKRQFSNFIINNLLGRYIGNSTHTIIPNYGHEINKNEKNQLLLSFSVRDVKIGVTRKDYLLVYEWENIPNSTLQKFRVDLTLQNPEEETIKK